MFPFIFVCVCVCVFVCVLVRCPLQCRKSSQPRCHMFCRSPPSSHLWEQVLRINGEPRTSENAGFQLRDHLEIGPGGVHLNSEGSFMGPEYGRLSPLRGSDVWALSLGFRV